MLSHRDASHALAIDARRSQARRFGPCAADGGAHVASTYSAHHRAGSRPHALGRASPWLRPTVGNTVRAAVVNRPARSLRNQQLDGSISQAAEAALARRRSKSSITRWACLPSLSSVKDALRSPIARPSFASISALLGRAAARGGGAGESRSARAEACAFA